MRYADRIHRQIQELGDCPMPTDVALEHSERLYERVSEQLKASPMSFHAFMQAMLYTPGLGYYSAGATKLGAQGDFVTAPEISELFGQAVAQQCLQILNMSGGSILEYGAGTGQLALDILTSLQAQDALPEHYYIMEVSADLIERQKTLLSARLPEFYEQIEWLDSLPEAFEGVVVANEVLDAMPVHRFQITEQGITEQQVVIDEQGDWHFSGSFDLSQPLKDWFAREDILALDMQPPYMSEVNLAQEAWIAELAGCLKKGAIMLIDYGFSRGEYYHRDRSAGTLMCHYRHRAHANPLVLAGLQDITTHVDFTAVAEAAHDAGLDVNGYTTQSSFLMGNGILQMAEELMVDAPQARQLQISSQLKQLLMPEEMGEFFKVMLLSEPSTLSGPINGFSMGDHRHQL